MKEQCFGVKMEIFQKNIIELRKANKYTQKQVAEVLNITQPSYIRYENGKAEPSLENLVKLANLYDVSIDFLCGRSDI